MLKDGDRKQVIDRVCRSVLERNSLDDQIIVLIEEMGDLISNLCRYKLEGKLNANEPGLDVSIMEEMAKVKIGIRQLELTFECEKDVKKAMEDKAKEIGEGMGLKF
jgi:hypothetical protein